MLPLIPGWTVARSIPPDVILGLLTKQYMLSGGVIRWVAGTEHAGQIVRHLLPVGNVANKALFVGMLPSHTALAQVQTIQQLQQLTSLQAATQQILGVASTTMMLSGLTLAVSSISFAVLNQKLDKLDARLAEIQKDVQAIRSLLERKERAALRSALESLSKVSLIENPITRANVINGARQTLAEMTVQYGELLANSTQAENALAVEEFFCLAALAHARCYIETDDVRMAHDQLATAFKTWRNEAQRIARDVLIGDNPERFLYSDFVDAAPTESVVAWLDFAEGKELGYKYVDRLRRQMRPWYQVRRISIGIKVSQSLKNQSQRERDIVVPALQKLTAREQVWQGYLAQAHIFVEHGVSPRQFEHSLADVPEASIIDGYVILEPEQSDQRVEKRRWWG